ncbi:D-aminoacyl-tRNA deacylase [Methanolobus bombayensis]|uniref:D-aminoacyl-tRNA deacylase n=1 Tax=Methanolobus bombayensis TaxID=38023 RepID=UPI001FD74F70|nr:D-aminoacyl-tRNA deacylase [Methanolobus bombayensis]MBP1910061.1 D-aminoacyl-tRNA deacylase [Methanolobus bombayensis]
MIQTLEKEINYCDETKPMDGLQNMKKTNILCSAADAASQNIKNHLLHNTQWEKPDQIPDDWEGLNSIYENQEIRILEIEGHHIYEDQIDEKMRTYGFETDLIVVASKHKSNDGRSVLTAHFTGNPDKADFGGRPKELSVAAPHVLRLILRNMKELAENIDYEVNMESTHHGPTDLKTPMVYAEIGSSEKQWNDPEAGDIASKAILEAIREFNASKKTGKYIPIAVGFGGGHYASRQTELILGAEVTFGHNFPDYQLSFVDRNIMLQAFEKSGADFAYFDRKSMSSKERERLAQLLDELGFVLLRESDIREIGEVQWELFMEIKEKCNDLCPEGKFRITEVFRSGLKKSPGEKEREYGELTQCQICEELFQETVKASKKLTEEMLIHCAPIYMERKNGTLSNTIMGMGEETKSAMQNVTNECIKILKEHYEIKYIPDENILCISNEKFNPRAAKELGIPAGPMLGELARGNSVVVEGKTITPGMVHKRRVKHIHISN